MQCCIVSFFVGCNLAEPERGSQYFRISLNIIKYHTVACVAELAEHQAATQKPTVPFQSLVDLPSLSICWLESFERKVRRFSQPGMFPTNECVKKPHVTASSHSCERLWSLTLPFCCRRLWLNLTYKVFRRHEFAKLNSSLWAEVPRNRQFAALIFTLRRGQQQSKEKSISFT